MITDNKGAIIFLIIFFIFIGFIAVSLIANNIGYNEGYKEGQINYSLGKIKYTVMEGIKVHFYGTVEEKDSL